MQCLFLVIDAKFISDIHHNFNSKAKKCWSIIQKLGKNTIVFSPEITDWNQSVLSKFQKPANNLMSTYYIEKLSTYLSKFLLNLLWSLQLIDVNIQTVPIYIENQLINENEQNFNNNGTNNTREVSLLRRSDRMRRPPIQYRHDQP